VTSLGPPPPGLELVTHLALPQLCGQLLYVGFQGETLPDPLIQAIEAGLRGGVVLFSRNCPGLEQTWRLCRAIASAAPTEMPLLIAVDEEGGRVSRMPAGVVKLPSMRRLGSTGDPARCYRAAALLARQLSAMGISCDFAPVLDVDASHDGSIIGDRSFSGDPHCAAQLALAFARGLEDHGIAPCGKHFPGHGGTELDSHYVLPRLDVSRSVLDARELVPFREAVAAKIPALMTAHVAYRAFVSELPATLNPQICRQLLRSEMGFAGVLFSDDLEMGAVNDRDGIEQNAVASIRAGCDGLLICSQQDLADRALEALVSAAEQEPEFSVLVERSAIRMLGMRRRFPPRPALSLTDLQQILGRDQNLAKALADTEID